MTTNKFTLLNEKDQARTSNKWNNLSIKRSGSGLTGLKLVFTAFIIVMLLFIITHVIKFPGSVAYLMEITNGQKTLDLQGSFSTAETYHRLEAFGDSGRKAYMRTMLTVDLIFPISMFIFLFILAKYTSQQFGRNNFGNLLKGLSIAYLLLDFLENVSIFLLLSNFPNRLDFLASDIGYLTLGKRTAMTGALFIPILLLLIRKASTLFKGFQFAKVK